jgi:hypothetical protein
MFPVRYGYASQALAEARMMHLCKMDHKDPRFKHLIRQEAKGTTILYILILV